MSIAATPSPVSTMKQITLSTAQIEILDGILVGTARAADRLKDKPIADTVREILAEVRNSE